MAWRSALRERVKIDFFASSEDGELLERVTEDIVNVAEVETVLYKLSELPADVDGTVEGCNEDI